MISRIYLRNLAVSCSFLVTHPSEIRRCPRWLRERKSSTFELRQPWWPYRMIDYVGSILPPNPKVFEYGGGGSSIWLCDRGAQLTIVEHHQDWARELRATLPSTVGLSLIPTCERGSIVSSVEDGYFDKYVQAIDSYPDGSFDLIIVDGRARVDCVLRAREKVKPSGYLLLEDSDRGRYEIARQAMSSWPEKSIKGLKAGSPVPAKTSIWARPN